MRFSFFVVSFSHTHTQKKQNCKGKRWEWSRWRRKTRKWTTSYGRAKKIMPAKVGFRSRGLQIVPRRINYESDALPTELPRLGRYKSELSLTWMVFLFKPYSWKYMFLNTTPQTRQPFFSAGFFKLLMSFFFVLVSKRVFNETTLQSRRRHIPPT